MINAFKRNNPVQNLSVSTTLKELTGEQVHEGVLSKHTSSMRVKKKTKVGGSQEGQDK